LEATLWAEVEPDASRRLIQAAVAAFSEHGYEATTTGEIADRAGLSPAGMYIHYPSKADMLFEIASTAHAAALAAVENAVQRHELPTERVHAFVEASVRWHAEHHVAARVIQSELAALSPEHFGHVRRLRDSYERLLKRDIRRGLADRVFTTDAADIAILAILSLGIDVARWYRAGIHPSPERLGAAYADLALVMLEGAGVRAEVGT
jgi:AcrR family transcriptional regulator